MFPSKSISLTPMVISDFWYLEPWNISISKVQRPQYFVSRKSERERQTTPVSNFWGRKVFEGVQFHVFYLLGKRDLGAFYFWLEINDHKLQYWGTFKSMYLNVVYVEWLSWWNLDDLSEHYVIIGLNWIQIQLKI